MRPVRCSFTFKRVRVGTLDSFASGVRDGIYITNPTLFPSPPLTQPQLTTLITEYTTAYANYRNARGLVTKGAFNAAAAALTTGLVDTAAYVDTVADGDSAIIEQGGFIPTKETGSSKPKPGTITGAVLTLGASQELLTECDPQPQIDTYVAILTEGVPLPPEVTIDNNGMVVMQPGTMGLPRTIYTSYSKSRRKSFPGLNVGTVYYLVMFGIGTGGVGQLCEPVRRMCN